VTDSECANSTVGVISFRWECIGEKLKNAIGDNVVDALTRDRDEFFRRKRDNHMQ